MMAISKYISPQNLMEWLRQPQWNYVGKSNIRKVVLQAMPLISDGITWRIHSGAMDRIGIDPWIECGNAHRLPEELRTHLFDKGITHLSHIADNDHKKYTQQA